MIYFSIGLDYLFIFSIHPPLSELLLGVEEGANRTAFDIHLSTFLTFNNLNF